MSILLLPRPRSILQYGYNGYGSVPFMTGFRTPDSLIAHRMPFVSSRFYSILPSQPHALCIPVCGMFLGPLHTVFMCYCLYTL